MDDHDERERQPQVIEVHVHHHFDQAIPVLLAGPITVLLGTATSPAIGARLTIGEAPPMSTANLTVDTANAQATLEYVDDKGDTNAVAPAGTVATFTSDNPAALTIDATSGAISIVGEGVSNVGVTLADASGNPLLEADGVTPWTTPDPVAVTVDPGAAVGAQLAVS